MPADSARRRSYLCLPTRRLMWRPGRSSESRTRCCPGCVSFLPTPGLSSGSRPSVPGTNQWWQLGLILPGVAVFSASRPCGKATESCHRARVTQSARHRLTAIRHALESAGVGEDLKMMEGVI